MEQLEHLELARSMCERLNDWNVWNGRVPLVSGAQRLNDWNVWDWLLHR
jgi:hypothetical protein